MGSEETTGTASCKIPNSNDEVFIIDEETIRNFFKDSNYEKAELFFIYLTTHCENNKAYMIPYIFNKIVDKIKEKTKQQGITLQTELISYFENWVQKADFLGEDYGEEKNDVLLLYKILSVVHPGKKIIILSSKYAGEIVNSLDLESMWGYLLSKKDFSEYLRATYGFNDDSSY